MRTVGERDFSAQETTHMLLSLPLVSCSFNFITISLNGSKKIDRDRETRESSRCRGHSWMNMHSVKRDFPLPTSQDFAANYTITNGQLVKRPKPVVVRTFPYHSSNPQGPQYPQYCRYQLIKYHPWSSHTAHAWQQRSATDEECVSAYASFFANRLCTSSPPISC